MRKPAAAVGSTVFFLVAPCTVAGLIPWLLTRWESVGFPAWWWALRAVGIAFVLVGAVVVIDSFVRFVREGAGTPVPAAPPEHLVVGGWYRFVRNPMYVALLLAMAGQTLIFGHWGMLIYTVAMWVPPAAFVKWYEEPKLESLFGEEFRRYRRAVPAWIPRLRPWNAPHPG
ncbi:MAG TPA: isoprenylcysteine carboxylmethyltransferase family protein [Stackebrandtia sp.]|jgi:protein-S-isoprenylcysteine O-methyltransferase Ste14|uniref:methyltransferase family protein n=1 Tax=Stackebrandtia sp. TaxID=2023065 RepID=UPI002D22650F|nr:isoprenylcysteine carboxylmethyltransferase family protein [Stackebrandtia sp.]HZE39456.1 isoprenylcysteine carboxylmethyltransferase family protein [Stackebrandtia sp.]